jgi:hypothetical protein
MQAAVEVVREQLEATGQGDGLAVAFTAQASTARDEAGTEGPAQAPAPESSATALAFGDVTPATALFIPEDEQSVPPASDLDTDHFFSGPPSSPAPRILAVEDDPFLWVDARDPRTRSLAPQAVARRAFFARYVRGAVGVSLVLCLAAVVKTALTHDDYEPPRRYAATAVWPPPEDAPPPVAADLPPATEAQPAAPDADGGVAATPAAPAASKPADDPAAAGLLRVR